MGSINGEGRLGIFGGDKEIRGMMVDRRIWILSRSGVEIGLSANQLSDLGGAMGIFKEDWDLGMLRGTQGIEEIRVMIAGQRIWLLSDLEEIRNLGNQLSDLGEIKEDRARSYKGVVINGEVSKQETSKDQRDYYGKGKGKMYEEPESKWVKVPERGSKRPSSYRATTRGEEERSRPRNSRWEQSRYPMQEDRNMYQRGARSARSPMAREREGPKEEGEISVTERRQRNLHKVENNGAKSAPVEASVTAMDLEGETGDRAEIENLVNGLEQGMDLVGAGKVAVDSETMKLDGTVALVEREEDLLGGDDEFQALTDGEVEETDKLDEVMRGLTEGEEELRGNGDQDNQVGEEEKKKRARKVMFKKPPGITVGTSKMRLVQAVLSPRKNGAPKPSKRQGGGEGAKQTEEKGPLHPKNSTKPAI
ncbi:hypothetical protein F2Q70_00021784 [Brassica cretica]|uniref:DUF4283 domain-containing protein n=1 Tax=Brassica cretica TaxID=69181 RepID=A0A8S9HJV2_BRACR|nr:hypothetical protein F2Q70_00021784 [Brassica cretica]KAF2558243.1 hypothetical protein F2Q68_00015494 [Brassica cretica]